FLRIVSRVYLTGGVIVSLNRTHAGGMGLEGGVAPKVGITTPEGKLNEDYSKILDQLSKSMEPAKSAAEAGAAFKFISASESSVSMAEAFDRPLAIGYLGFDVQLLSGGEIGAPIPTFDHLEGRVPASPHNVVGPLTDQQKRFKIDLAALEAL